jgi:outer membrane protein W
MRTVKLGLGVFFLVCCAAGTAVAQEPGARGGSFSSDFPSGSGASGRFVIGLRTGYAIAMGKVADGADNDLSDGISGHIPIWLDLGYMVTPNVMLGLYGHYGFGLLASDISDYCDTGNLDCSASVVRVGAQGQYHFSPMDQIDPWLGVGIGYEWMSLSMSGSGIDRTGGAHGFEFLNLQGGADFKLSPAFGLGPFASFSLGQYGTMTLSGSGADRTESIDQKAFHEWLTLGVRGAFTL